MNLTKQQKFIYILKIEIAELISDIESSVKQLEADKLSEKISNYVYMENNAVMDSKMLGLEHFLQILNECNPDNFTTLEQLIDHLKNALHDTIKEHGLVEAPMVSVRQKFDKVLSYIQSKS